MPPQKKKTAPRRVSWSLSCRSLLFRGLFLSQVCLIVNRRLTAPSFNLPLFLSRLPAFIVSLFLLLLLFASSLQYLFAGVSLNYLFCRLSLPFHFFLVYLSPSFCLSFFFHSFIATAFLILLLLPISLLFKYPYFNFSLFFTLSRRPSFTNILFFLAFTLLNVVFITFIISG